jgi:hypothetical protein
MRSDVSVRVYDSRSRLSGVAILLVAIITSPEVATAPRVLNDPIFTLDYDPKIAKFETIPVGALLPACKINLSEFKPLPKSFILYAKLETPEVRIYIAAPPDAYGIYIIRGATCDSGVAQLALLRRRHEPTFRGDTPYLSEDEVKAIFGDSLSRYARAFGGKEPFLGWLDSNVELFKRLCRDPVSKCEPIYAESPTLSRVLDDYRRNE